MNDLDMLRKAVGTDGAGFGLGDLGTDGADFVWSMLMKAHNFFTGAYPALLIFSIMVGFVLGMLSTRNKKARRFFYIGMCITIPAVLTFVEYIVPYLYEASMSAASLLEGRPFLDVVWGYILYLQAALTSVYIPAMVFCLSVGLILQYLARQSRDMRRYVVFVMCIGLPLVLTAFEFAVPQLHRLF